MLCAGFACKRRIHRFTGFLVRFAFGFSGRFGLNVTVFVGSKITTWSISWFFIGSAKNRHDPAAYGMRLKYSWYGV
jgi:hypothetical protein